MLEQPELWLWHDLALRLHDALLDDPDATPDAAALTAVRPVPSQKSLRLHSGLQYSSLGTKSRPCYHLQTHLFNTSTLVG